MPDGIEMPRAPLGGNHVGARRAAAGPPMRPWKPRASQLERTQRQSAGAEPRLRRLSGRATEAGSDF